MATLQGNCDDYTRDKLINHVRQNFDDFKAVRPSLTHTELGKMKKLDLCELVLIAPHPPDVPPEVAAEMDDIAAAAVAEAATAEAHPVQKNCRKQLKKDIVNFVFLNKGAYPALASKSEKALARMTIAAICDEVERQQEPQGTVEPQEEAAESPSGLPDCSKKLKADIIGWIKANLARYPSFAGKSESALNKMKKDDLCAVVNGPRPIPVPSEGLPPATAAIVEEIMREPIEAPEQDEVETACSSQLKSKIIGYIQRNIESFPIYAGKSAKTLNSKNKTDLCAEVKRVTDQKRQALEAKAALLAGDRSVIETIRKDEIAAEKQAVADLRKHLPYVLASEKVQDAIADLTVVEYLSPDWVAKKLAEKKVGLADSKRVLRNAVKIIFANAKEGKINLYESNPKKIATDFKTVSQSSRDLKDAIFWLYDRESYMFQFIGWLKNIIDNEGRMLFEAENRREKREKLLIVGDCLTKRRGDYITLLLGHRELFPEVANLSASEINNLPLDDLCKLVVKAKRAKVVREIQAVSAGEGFFEVAPEVKNQLTAHLEATLATMARFFSWLLLPQYNGNADIPAAGPRRADMMDVVGDWKSQGAEKFNVLPILNANLTRYILTDLLPYGRVLQTPVGGVFAVLPEFQNLPQQPFNDSMLQSMFLKLLPPVIRDSLKGVAGVKQPDSFLSPESLNLLRSWLVRLAVNIATSDGAVALDFDPASVSSRSAGLFVTDSLVAESDLRDKLIDDYVWIIAAGCDWLDKQDVDGWDVYWATSILTNAPAEVVRGMWENTEFTPEMNSLASAIRRKFDAADLLIDPSALKKLTGIISFLASPEATVDMSRVNMFARGM
jgi:hypothetical protein